MITLKPYGGLGNRMRSIDSVLAISEITKIPVKIIWENTPELFCDLNLLFRLPENVVIVTKAGIQSKIINRLYKIILFGLRTIGFKFPSGYKYLVLEKDIERLRKQNYDFKKLAAFESVYIETCERFFSADCDFETFKPTDSIFENVESLTQKFPKKTIGVHIRRTDNHKSLQMSPLNSFIELMNSSIREDSETKFFLATDSIQIEEIMQEQFSDRIIMQPGKRLKRNDPEAIQSAFVDMLCLSRTQKIFGSYWSSFSETAASIGKIELITVKNQ